MSDRSLLPREHGAYFQLAMPLSGAFLVRLPTPAGLGIAIAACLAFLAHEPASIVLGGRGKRLRLTEGARARRRLVMLAVAAAAAGAVGLVLAPVATLLVAVLVLAAGAVVIVLAARRIERTQAGEVVAGAALTGASAVVLVASGASLASATLYWGGWTVGFGVTTLAVHRVLARHKHGATVADDILTCLLGILAVGSLATIGGPFGAIVAPLATIATALVLVPPRAMKLRTVGIAIAVASAVSVALRATIVA